MVGEALEAPFLPAAPGEGKCRWCDYRDVCGPYEELRSRRKPLDHTGRVALVRLRSLP